MDSLKKYFGFIVLGFLFYSCGVETSNQMESNLLKKVKAEIKVEEKPEVTTQIDTTISLAFLMGQFDAKNHPDFTAIKVPFGIRTGMYLQKESYNAFKKMHEAAKKEGINLSIISATRSFSSQKSIWEAKWEGRKKNGGKLLPKSMTDPNEKALTILNWSSMPGSSRHHWGTDIDINKLNNAYFEKGQGLKEYEWLMQNGSRFGFCQTYTEKDSNRPNGYNEEKWHWSYFPLSKKYTLQADLRLKDEMINGFKGSEVASEIGIVDKYILGINKACLH